MRHTFRNKSAHTPSKPHQPEEEAPPITGFGLAMAITTVSASSVLTVIRECKRGNSAVNMPICALSVP